MKKKKSVRLAYGEHGLELETGEDWNVAVIEPLHTEGIIDAAGAIETALRNPTGSSPLKQLVQPGDKVAIIFNDITRPTPNKLIIETILKEINHIPESSVILFNATGQTRRVNYVQ
jgi:nickel-dependent lactate racemase